MAQLHNREYYIIKEGKGDRGRECVCGIPCNRCLLLIYIYSRSGAATHEKKEKRERKKEPRGVARKNCRGGRAAVPNNQIRPYFPGPQLQYRPRPPLNSKKARLARPGIAKGQKKKKRKGKLGNRESAGGRDGEPPQKRRKKVEGAHTRRTSPRPPPLPPVPPPPHAPTPRR